MVNRQVALKIRTIHRYLGLFIGIQFLFWTVSGLYFSWTNLDEIHGDHLKDLQHQPEPFVDLISPAELPVEGGIRSVELRDIHREPYYWVNNNKLFHARKGNTKEYITEKEALYIAGLHMNDQLKVAGVTQIEQTGSHHEYREKLLPAFVISYEGEENTKAYVSAIDGKFQTVRHRNWRIFDFLWMTHTMDYQGRDNFNTTLLRAFSLLGLLTVLSGFTLWFITSPRILKMFKKIS